MVDCNLPHDTVPHESNHGTRPKQDKANGLDHEVNPVRKSTSLFIREVEEILDE